MKVTPKRQRSDSTAAAIQAAQSAASGLIAPPEGVSLRLQDQPFWEAITQARPRATWTDVDLMHAASLARTMADIELLQDKLNKEGYTHGDSIYPAFGVIEKLTRRALALSRQLHVHALATVGRSGDAAGLAELERQARGQELDDLIPMGGA